MKTCISEHIDTYYSDLRTPVMKQKHCEKKGKTRGIKRGKIDTQENPSKGPTFQRWRVQIIQEQRQYEACIYNVCVNMNIIYKYMYAQPSNYSSPITPDQVAVLTNTGRGLILNNQSVEETEKKEDQLINHVSKSHQSVIRINRDPPPRVRRVRGEEK